MRENWPYRNADWKVIDHVKPTKEGFKVVFLDGTRRVYSCSRKELDRIIEEIEFECLVGA